MTDNDGPSPKVLGQQMEAYARELTHYQAYAEALKRVLILACKESIPDVIVQSRAKSMSSFVEKSIRRFKKYPNPAKDFTDLCGARVIVQTQAQVEAVKRFIERNFDAFEQEDKSSLLGEDKFGYRDMHYLVRLRQDRAQPIGFTKQECDDIGGRVAEVQVRSIVQHAWADILHDRIYKAPLKLSTEARRTGALLAAIMEDGDRSFDQLAGELDGMTANYSAYASRENVQKEIKVNQLLYEHCSEEERPKLALRLARLIAADGKWSEIVPLLERHQQVGEPLRMAILLELGHAHCRRHRSDPKSPEYRNGQEMLERVITCEDRNMDRVPNLRRNRSIHARALARLGWSLEPFDAEAYRARECYRRAVELEPANPYYLADMLGFELKFTPGTDLVAGFRASIHSALAVCRQHSAAGAELPSAFFTAARLNMLLREYHPALEDYACGIRHWLGEDGCVDCNFLEDEIAWLHRVHSGEALPGEFQWAEDLLLLALSLKASSPAEAPTSAPPKDFKLPVLIVAGGAASLRSEDRPAVESRLQEALAVFRGTVISGGTTSGVPGCVGTVAGRLAKAGQKGFRLMGYVPRSLPHDAKEDKNYDDIIVIGTDTFSPSQVMHAWQDVLAAGVKREEVRVLGFGGGKIAAFEYRLALALGATVGVVPGSGGAVDDLLKDPLWSAVPGLRLFPLPPDAKTLRAFVVPDGFNFNADTLDEMAQEFHARYRAENLHKTKPDNLKLWKDLPPTYRKANREQAAYSIRILETTGFGVRQARGKPAIFKNFTPEEIELMAELEHGRWNIERLQDGWRYGKTKDEDHKLNPCIVPWEDLPDGPDGVKRYDREAVRAFPEILARAGLEVYRKPKKAIFSKPKRKK
jgi:ppGpp synthetase/RelA/SpoT-type nucleotidyltranferase